MMLSRVFFRHYFFITSTAPGHICFKSICSLVRAISYLTKHHCSFNKICKTMNTCRDDDESKTAGTAPADDDAWVKLTTAEAVHHGFSYKEGLNIDVHPFNPNSANGRGGLYFAKRKDIHLWLDMHPELQTMWDVEIPSGERIAVFEHKAKAHRIILRNPRPIPYEVWLRGAQHNGNILKRVPEEHKETMAFLVQLGDRWDRFKWAFLSEPFKDKTFDCYQAAVRHKRELLEHVPDEHKTLELCLTAVRHDGYLLEHVPDEHKTPELCLVAVHILALQSS